MAHQHLKGMGLIFLLWICIAAVSDALYRKVFNWLAILGGFAAFISLWAYPELHPVNISLYDGLLGGFSGFFVLLIFYVLKMMGAGDVKFAASLGFWVGWELLLPIWALSCGFAVIHGVVVKSGLKYFFSPSTNWEGRFEERRRKFIPYVTYLSISAVIVLIMSK